MLNLGRSLVNIFTFPAIPGRRSFHRTGVAIAGATGLSLLMPPQAQARTGPLYDRSWTLSQLAYISSVDPIPEMGLWAPDDEKDVTHLFKVLRDGYLILEQTLLYEPKPGKSLPSLSQAKSLFSLALTEIPIMRDALHNYTVTDPSLEYILVYVLPRALARLGLLTVVSNSFNLTLTDSDHLSSGQQVEVPILSFSRITRKEPDVNKNHPWYGSLKAPLYSIEPYAACPTLEFSGVGSSAPLSDIPALTIYGAIFWSRRGVQSKFNDMAAAIQQRRNIVEKIYRKLGIGPHIPDTKARQMIVDATRTGRLKDFEVYSYGIVQLVNRGIGDRPLKIQDVEDLILSHEISHFGEEQDESVQKAQLIHAGRGNEERALNSEKTGYLGGLRAASNPPLAFADIFLDSQAEGGPVIHREAIQWVLRNQGTELVRRPGDFGIDMAPRQPGDAGVPNDAIAQVDQMYNHARTVSRFQDNLYQLHRAEMVAIVAEKSPASSNPRVESPYPSAPSPQDNSSSPPILPIVVGTSVLLGTGWSLSALYQRKRKLWLRENIRSLGIRQPDVTWITLNQLKAEDGCPNDYIQRIYNVARGKDPVKAKLAEQWLRLFASHTRSQLTRTAIQTFLNK